MIIKTQYANVESIDRFKNFFNSLQMRYLASDLLHLGLSPTHISDAVERAIRVAKSSGIDIRIHFMPVFSAINKEIIAIANSLN